MKGLVLLCLLGYPLLELYALVTVASWIGALATIGLLALSAMVGLGILRETRGEFVAGFRSVIGRNGPVLPELLDRLIRAAGAILLILPGLLTDLVALPLLVPISRRYLTRRLGRFFGATFVGIRPHRSVVIEGEFHEIGETGPAGSEKPSLPRPSVPNAP